MSDIGFPWRAKAVGRQSSQSLQLRLASFSRGGWWYEASTRFVLVACWFAEMSGDGACVGVVPGGLGQGDYEVLPDDGVDSASDFLAVRLGKDLLLGFTRSIIVSFPLYWNGDDPSCKCLAS